MKEAIEHAINTRELPPNMEWGENDYCIEFLFRYFCRNAPERYLVHCQKERWKTSIRNHLSVFRNAIGLMKCGPYKIELKEGAEPVSTRPYPLSPEKRLALDKMLDVLLDNKVIEPSTNADWSSPVLLVAKGTTPPSFRMVIDFRKLNSLIENKAVVYPRVDDIMEVCQDAIYMVLIDARDYYFQRELDPESRDYTTFKCHRGSFRWCRCPQGMRTSSAAAIMPVARELHDMLYSNVLMYCDDILCWNKDEEASLELFEKLIKRLKDYGLTVGWNKVFILLNKACYVSHVIEDGTVRPSPKLTKCIDELPNPTTVKQVQCFLGLVQYYRMYIPFLSEHAACLTELTKKDTPFVWGEQHTTAVESIKSLLNKAILYIVDWNADLWLVSDASGSALGAVLLMKKDDRFYPLKFVSRMLTPLERAYENRERELRAGVFGMQSMHVYLEHRVFTWAVDHLNLTFIMKAAASNGRLARLAIWLSMWQYNIVHLAGTHVLMQIADAISRLAINNSEDGDLAHVPFEDDAVQSIFTDAIDPAKTIDRYDPNTYKMSNSDTKGVLLHDGTSMSIPVNPKVGGARFLNMLNGTCEVNSAIRPTRALNMLASIATELPINVVELFHGLGSISEALNQAGARVIATVANDNAVTLPVDGRIAFSSTEELSRALEQKTVRMPHIDMVVATIHYGYNSPGCFLTPTAHTTGMQICDAVQALNKRCNRIRCITIFVPEVADIKKLGLTEGRLKSMGYLTYEEPTKYRTTSFGDPLTHSQCVLVYSNREMIKLPNHTHYSNVPARPLLARQLYDLPVEVFGTCGPLRHRSMSEDLDGEGKELCETESTKIYEGSGPLPRMRPGKQTALATIVDATGAPVNVHIMEACDYAALYGLPHAGRSAMAQWPANIAAKALHRTPTSLLARAVMTTVVKQLSSTGRPSEEASLSDQGFATIRETSIKERTFGAILRSRTDTGAPRPQDVHTRVTARRGHRASDVTTASVPAPACTNPSDESEPTEDARASTLTFDWLETQSPRNHTSEKESAPTRGNNPGENNEAGPGSGEGDKENESLPAQSITITREEIRCAQRDDPDIQKIARAVDARARLKECPTHERRAASESYRKAIAAMGKRLAGYAQSTFREDDGILRFADANRQVPVPIITKELGQKAILMSHGAMSTVHIGNTRAQAFIRLRFWWIGMRHDITHHVKHCLQCQRCKFEASPGYGFAHLRFYDTPGKCIAVDVVVLNMASPSGTKYFFTVLDTFSHWCDAYPMPDMESATCAEALWQWIKNCGLPDEVRSDRGQNLNLSEIFKELYKLFKIKGQLSAAWSPQSNPVERLHKWLGAALRLLFAEHDMEVEKSAEFAIYIYRSTPNLVTGFTPFLLHHGRESRFPTEVFEDKRADLSANEYVAHLQELMPQVYDVAKVAQMQAQERAAEYYNERHGALPDIVEGDHVFLADHSHNRSDMPVKVLPKCTGPWRVVRHSTSGVDLENVYSGLRKAASLRHVRRAHVVPSADLVVARGHQPFDPAQHGQVNAGRAPGAMAIVRMPGHTAAWHVARLVSTQDDYLSWTIQWYNIDMGSPKGTNRVTAPYFPCWADESDVEARTHEPAEGHRPLQHCVNKARICHPTFALAPDHTLPSNIRALLKSKYKKHQLITKE